MGTVLSDSSKDESERTVPIDSQKGFASKRSKARFFML